MKKNNSASRRLVYLGFTLALIAVISLPATAFSINKNAGTTGFAFLKLGVGARAVAMGGAYTSVADDPSIIYYNPAGTIELEGKQFLAGYHNYVLDIQSGFLAHTRPMGEKLKLGLFIDYLNFGEFTRMDINGEPEGEFSGGDFLFGVNAAMRLTPALAAGASIKYIHEAADSRGADAFAADIGLYYKFGDSLTTAGLSFYNLGGVISGFTDHKDKLPMGLRGGLSHSLRELPLVIAIDGVLPNDNDAYANIGAEFFKFEPLYLRLGYSLFGDNYKTGSGSDGWGGISAGFGLDIKKYHISYAFTPYLDLGSSHRVTIAGEF
jgi:hypothetical protein